MKLHFEFRSDNGDVMFEFPETEDCAAIPRIGEQIVHRDANGEHVYLISNMVWDPENDAVSYVLE